MSLGNRSEWLRRRDELDACPWPGAVPLGEGQRDQLIGREEDLDAFLSALHLNKLVMLHGDSGVGKSSFLNALLIESLEGQGKVVALCNDWSGGHAGGEGVGSLLAERIRNSLMGRYPADGFESIPDQGFFIELKERIGTQMVIVLDQFEELLRADRFAFVHGLFQLIAGINQQTEIKIVVSLRSEYREKLRPLEKLINTYTFADFPLQEVADDPDAPLDESPGLKIALSGNRGLEGSRAIDDAAAALVAQVWRAANQMATDEVGLINLQALLYVLHDAAGGDASTVEDRHARALMESLGFPDAADQQADAVGLLRRALARSSQLKINRCRAAALEIGVDDVLVTGTEATIDRMISHLASGSYKVQRSSKDLLGLALEDELEVIQRGLRGCRSSTEQAEGDGPLSLLQLDALLDVMLDALDHVLIAPGLAMPQWDLLQGGIPAILAIADAEVARRAQTESDLGAVALSARLHPGSSPLALDAAEITSGVMMGQAPVAALAESLRQFCFAIDWLESSRIISVSSLEAGDVTIKLVHDRFSQAIDDLRASSTAILKGKLEDLVVKDGQVLFLKSIAGLDPLGPVEGGEPFRYITNKRWKGVWIEARFERVIFINCDLRGAIFNECTFEGVSFVNCLLDGALFSDCIVTREAEDLDNDSYSTLPEYLVQSPAQARQLLAYRTDAIAPEGEVGVLSRIPGFPAVPTSVDALPEEVITLAPPLGSLSFFGCRMALFGFRNLGCESGGAVIFRNVAGSGVKFVEHQKFCEIRISSCALRHLEVSSDPHVTGDGGEVRMTIRSSSMVQTWFGDDIHGTVDIWGCRVAQGFNSSRMGLKVRVHTDPEVAFGLVGFVFVDEAAGGGSALGVEEVDPNGGLWQTSRRIDYRRASQDGDLPFPTPVVGGGSNEGGAE